MRRNGTVEFLVQLRSIMLADQIIRAWSIPNSIRRTSGDLQVIPKQKIVGKRMLESEFM